ncbi:MAG: DUF447 domain-containing protein [Promethearchaeota archaeon]
MSITNFNPKDFGLKKDILYEILATAFIKNKKTNQIMANTSCMGIRLIENNFIKIMPFQHTITFKNLSRTKLITINFVEDIDLYAYAALKQYKSPKREQIQKTPDDGNSKTGPPITLFGTKGFPERYYDSYKILTRSEENNNLEELIMPYINKSWGVLFCKVVDQKDMVRKDKFGTIKLTEFKLKVISHRKFKESHKIFNRAENLALETIILATRLNIAKETHQQEVFDKIKGRINEFMKEIERFGKNKKALKAIEVVSNYVWNLFD